MKRFLLIGIGGFLGAVLRAVVKNQLLVPYSMLFPWNTLLINVLGSFLIALFLTICMEVVEVDSDIRLCIATGFIGAFTTFSTVCKEAVKLLQHGQAAIAMTYLLVSILLGLSAVYAGTITVRIKVK